MRAEGGTPYEQVKLVEKRQDCHDIREVPTRGAFDPAESSMSFVARLTQSMINRYRAGTKAG